MPWALNTCENRAFWQLRQRTSLKTAGDSHGLLLEGHGPGQQLDPFNWRVHFLSLNIRQRWRPTSTMDGKWTAHQHNQQPLSSQKCWFPIGYVRFWHRVRSTLPCSRKQARCNLNDAFAANATPRSASGCDYPVTLIFYGNDSKLPLSVQFWLFFQSPINPITLQSLLPPTALETTQNKPTET